jgi:hypothetical protein
MQRQSTASKTCTTRRKKCLSNDNITVPAENDSSSIRCAAFELRSRDSQLRFTYQQDSTEAIELRRPSVQTPGERTVDDIEDASVKHTNMVGQTILREIDSSKLRQLHASRRASMPLEGSVNTECRKPEQEK